MNRLLATLLSILVAASAASVVSAGADWQSKVDASVLRAAADGATDFMVYMSAHADLSAADRISTKAATGGVVYDELTSPAPTGGPPAVGPSISFVSASDAWDLGYRGQGAVVAGADTGVRWTHSALKGEYRGWGATTRTADHNYSWHNAAGP